MAENKFAGTKTEKNLAAAFAGESQARNKYTYFASVARKEGYQQIAELFEETASNEKQHAKLWFQHLNGIGSTAENLKAAADGENYEWTDMYEQFARDAEEKGEEVMWQCRECGHLVMGKKAPEVCPICHHPQAYQQVRATNY